MRVAPKGSQNKVIWLVRFLESWYDKDELIHRAKRHIDALCKGDYHPKGAYYLTEALAWTCKLDMDVEHELKVQTRKFLEGKDESLLADLSPSDKELVEKSRGYYYKGEYLENLNILSKVKNQEGVYLHYGFVYKGLKDNKKAEKYWLMAVEKGNERAMTALGWLYKNEFKDNEKAEKYWLMAVEKSNESAMASLGWLYKNEFKDNEKAEKYYLMAEKSYLTAFEKGDVDAMNKLGCLYCYDFKDNKKAEKYWLMAVEKGHTNAMNYLSFMYFEEKIKKQDALKYAYQSVEQAKGFSNTHTLACVYLWHNQIEEAKQIEKEFMYNDETLNSQTGGTLYLMLLIAKGQDQHLIQYFEDPELNLKERFKPLYYALLHFTDNKDFHKMPPELAEPVKDIIEKVRQMAVDYA